jgi:hypothetical protein
MLRRSRKRAREGRRATRGCAACAWAASPARRALFAALPAAPLQRRFSAGAQLARCNDARTRLNRPGVFRALEAWLGRETVAWRSMRAVLLARRTFMAAQPAQRLATDTRCAAAVDAHTAELRAQKDAARRAMRATLRAIGKDALEEDSACGLRGTQRLVKLTRARRAAGRQAVQRLLASSAFGSSRRVGVYVSCERLREVNTHELLRVMLQPGAPCLQPAQLARRCCSPLLCRPLRSAAALLCPARRRRSGTDGVLSHWRVTAADVLCQPRVLTWLTLIDALSDLVASTMGILEPRALDSAGLPRDNGACVTARCPYASRG